MNNPRVLVHTLFDEKYYELANITVPNKIEYCEKHNYYFNYREKKFLYSHLDFLENDQCDLLYWCGADTLITNYNIKITDLIDDDYDFFICGDANGINADSFIIKNTNNSKNLLKDILQYQLVNNSKYEREDGYLNEQEVMVSFILNKYKNISSILPQRIMNSYNYDLYPIHHFGEQFKDKKDYLGNDGNWQQNDFIIHFPGQSLQGKINYAKQYIQQIKK
jgi:mannan polymerase II complex MNN10 subunit